MIYPAVPIDPNLLLQAQVAPISGSVAGVPVSTNQVTGEAQVPSFSVTNTKDPSFATTKIPATPELLAAEAKVAGSQQGMLNAVDKQAEVKAQQADIRAQQAEAERDDLARQAADREKIEAEADQRYAKSYTELKQSIDEKAKFKPTTYFEDMSPLRRALSALGMAFGTYASGMTGAPNTAYQIVQAGEQAHREKQRTLIDQQAAAIEMKTGNVKMAMDYRKRRLEEEAEKAILRNKYTIKQFDARAQRVPAAAAEAAEAKAKLEHDQAKEFHELVKMRTGTITNQGGERSVSTTEGKPTSGAPQQPPGKIVSGEDAKRAGYARSMKDSLGTVDKLAKEGVTLTDDDLRLLNTNIHKLRSVAEQATRGLDKPLWAQAMQKVGLTPDSFTDGLSDSKKVMANALMTASGLIIRDQSGAAITNPEDFTNAQKKMWAPGDGPKSRAEKTRVMAADADTMERVAGPEAYFRMYGQYPDWYMKGIEQQKAGAYSGAKPAAAPTPAADQTPAPKKYAAETATQIARDTAKRKAPKMTSEQSADVKAAESVLNDPKATPERKDKALRIIRSVRAELAGGQ